MRFWIFLAGLFGAAGIGALAYQSHGLAQVAGMDAQRLRDFAAAADIVRYQALALLGAALLTARMPWAANLAALAFAAGTFLFSSPLAAFALTGIRRAMWLAPIGGTTLITGWLVIAVCALIGLLLTKSRDPS